PMWCLMMMSKSSCCQRHFSRIQEPSTPKQASQRGFSLIEVLIAISIFALLSLAGYQVLNQTQRSNQVSLEKTSRIQKLQQAVVMMDNDFNQMSGRAFVHEGESTQDLFLLHGTQVIDSDKEGILFIRLGWMNPEQAFPRGEVLKVGYRLRNDVLERVWWRYPDTPSGEPALVRPILDKVTDLSFRFYNGSTWVNEWQEQGILPLAIEVNLNLEDYGDIKRVYALPSQDTSEDEAADDED
ncbi:MAG: type II secretion system minor pseudopilin GspJ, partial [Vibrio sp.]